MCLCCIKQAGSENELICSHFTYRANASLPHVPFPLEADWQPLIFSSEGLAQLRIVFRGRWKITTHAEKGVYEVVWVLVVHSDVQVPELSKGVSGDGSSSKQPRSCCFWFWEVKVNTKCKSLGGRPSPGLPWRMDTLETRDLGNQGYLEVRRRFWWEFWDQSFHPSEDFWNT